jgi:hypothetical protein
MAILRRAAQHVGARCLTTCFMGALPLDHPVRGRIKHNGPEIGLDETLEAS